MTGTTSSATLEMDFSPPRTTAATAMVTTMPMMATGRWNASLADSVIAFTCGKVPQPSSAVMIPKKAKSFASQIHFFPMPFWI